MARHLQLGDGILKMRKTGRFALWTKSEKQP